jgi:hypothetical protein
VTASARVPGGLWARPSQSRAAIAPGSLDADGSSQRWYRSARCSRHCRPDSGRRGSYLIHGIAVDPGSHSADISGPLGGGDVPANGCRCCRLASRLLGSRSCRDTTTCCTVATHEPIYLVSYVRLHLISTPSPFNAPHMALSRPDLPPC